MKPTKNNYLANKIKVFLKKSLFVIFLCFIFFYLLPFSSLILKKKYRTSFFRHITYTDLYRNTTSKATNDSLRVIQCFDFVCKNVSAQKKHEKVQDLSPLDVFTSGVGFCDQQANLLITLVEKGGLEGNLIFLFGLDSVSRHSVCEIKIQDKYIMFDPFYHLFFFTKTNTLASIEDIQNRNIQNLENQYIKCSYLNLFADKYPYKIYKRNRTNGIYWIINKTLYFWQGFFGKWAIKPYLFLYSQLEEE